MSLEDGEDRIDVAHDNTPLRYHIIDGILDGQPTPRFVQRNIVAELHLTHVGKPRSFIEGEGDATWCATMHQVPLHHKLADILTKSLGQVKFLELRTRIGLVHYKSEATHKV